MTTIRPGLSRTITVETTNDTGQKRLTVVREAGPMSAQTRTEIVTVLLEKEARELAKALFPSRVGQWSREDGDRLWAEVREGIRKKSISRSLWAEELDAIAHGATEATISWLNKNFDKPEPETLDLPGLERVVRNAVNATGPFDKADYTAKTVIDYISSKALRAADPDGSPSVLKELQETKDALDQAREELDRAQAERTDAEEELRRLWPEHEATKEALRELRTEHWTVRDGLNMALNDLDETKEKLEAATLYKEKVKEEARKWIPAYGGKRAVSQVDIENLIMEKFGPYDPEASEHDFVRPTSRVSEIAKEVCDLLNEKHFDEFFEEVNNPDPEKTALDEARIEANIQRNRAQRELEKVKEELEEVKKDAEGWRENANHRATVSVSTEAALFSAQENIRKLERELNEISDKKSSLNQQAQAWCLINSHPALYFDKLPNVRPHMQAVYDGITILAEKAQKLDDIERVLDAQRQIRDGSL